MFDAVLKEILNADEAGELLGFTGRHIRSLAKKGLIPGRKVGSEWRFSRSLLLQWIRGEKAA